MFHDNASTMTDGRCTLHVAGVEVAGGPPRAMRVLLEQLDGCWFGAGAAPYCMHRECLGALEASLGRPLPHGAELELRGDEFELVRRTRVGAGLPTLH